MCILGLVWLSAFHGLLTKKTCDKLTITNIVVVVVAFVSWNSFIAAFASRTACTTEPQWLLLHGCVFGIKF